MSSRARRLSPLEAVLAEIPRYLRRWTAHPLFDDLVALGRMTVWENWEGAADLDPPNRMAVLLKAVGWEVYGLLGSPANPYRSRTRRHTPPPMTEILFSEIGSPSETETLLAEAYDRTVPDFAAGVLSRMAVESEINRVAAAAWEAEVLRRLVFLGESDAEAAAAVGKTREQVCRMKRRLRNHGGVYTPRGAQFGTLHHRRVKGYAAWTVYASVDGKSAYFGSHKTVEEARIVLDAVIIAWKLTEQPLFLLPETARGENPTKKEE
jgi:hypothetical protein